MRFSTLSGWLDWQAGLSPKAIDLGLDRVRAVWQALDTPLIDVPVISIAGTNGKGSSVAFAETILQAAGYRCGCYTSPHLVSYNERIRIDQQTVDDAAICAVFERIDQARGDITLTYFEFGTLAALCLFAEAALDAVILEVGLGGRLDAVNIIDADVALISSIGLDHTDWLGDNREAIGREKAGIMRPGRSAVFASVDMPESIADYASEIGAELKVAGVDYAVTRHPDSWDLVCGERVRRSLPIPGMRGRIQIENAAGVLVALDSLAQRLPLDQASVRAGLLGARQAGRFDVRPGRPTLVLDVAHNPQAAGVLNDMLGDFYTPGKRIAVCGMLADKDAEGVIGALAKRFDAWYFVDILQPPRAQTAQALSQRAASVLDRELQHVGGDVGETLTQITALAGADDLVVVFGSFLTVGGAIEWLQRSA